MKHLSLFTISVLQAFGIILYCSLVGLLMWKGNTLFGPMPLTFIGPAMFLVLFIVSAVICALLFFGYPFILFWERKQTPAALRLVAYTTAWLTGFVVFVLSVLALR